MTRPQLVLDLTSSADGSEATVESEALPKTNPHAVVITSPPPSPTAMQRWTPGSMSSVAALVPNMTSYSPDASEQGLVGAALAKLRRSGPRTMARIGVIGMSEVRAALRMDLGVLVKILIELDLHDLRRFRPKRIVLAASITDVALAAANRPFFESYCRYARKKLGAEPWVETWNPGHLLRSMREWRTEVAGVVSPLNRLGHMMHPDIETSLHEIRRAPMAIWARDVTADGAIDLEEGMAFAESVGAQAVIVPGLRAVPASAGG
jgi:hypothetical protein